MNYFIACDKQIWSATDKYDDREYIATVNPVLLVETQPDLFPIIQHLLVL